MSGPAFLPTLKMAFPKDPVLALRLVLFSGELSLRRDLVLQLSAPLLGYLVCLLMNDGERLDGAMVRVALHRVTGWDPHSCAVPLILGGLFSFHVPGSAGAAGGVVSLWLEL